MHFRRQLSLDVALDAALEQIVLRRAALREDWEHDEATYTTVRIREGEGPVEVVVWRDENPGQPPEPEPPGVNFLFMQTDGPVEVSLDDGANWTIFNLDEGTGGAAADSAIVYLEHVGRLNGSFIDKVVLRWPDGLVGGGAVTTASVLTAGDES